MISYKNSLSNSKYKTIERIGLVIKGVYIVSSAWFGEGEDISTYNTRRMKLNTHAH
jgi:hypothetical protein